MNPAHLEPVTPLENSHRGRQPKLTIEIVREIRAAVAAGSLQREQAALYGVDRSEVSRVCRGEIWAEKGMLVQRPRRSSKHRGVGFDKRSGTWRAFISTSTRFRSLGYFGTEAEAAQAVAHARGAA